MRGDGVKEAGGGACAHQRAMPELGGLQGAVEPEPRGEVARVGFALEAERARRILLLGDGVGVTDEVELHAGGSGRVERGPDGLE